MGEDQIVKGILIAVAVYAVFFGLFYNIETNKRRKKEEDKHG
jgi:hypothetical protein